MSMSTVQRKCQICKAEIAEWAWQPWGPGENANTYSLLGSHYRGFPVIKVGEVCKNAFQTGDFEVKFEYKGYQFLGKNREVKQTSLDLWDGGTSSFASARDSGTLLMNNTPFGSELVAMVADPSLVPLFVAAPHIREACQELYMLQDVIENALNHAKISHEVCTTILLALAKVHVACPEEKTQ